MDYRLEPDEPSRDDAWIEQRVDDLLELPIEDLAEYSWFNDCIDWDKVQSYLVDVAVEELNDIKLEQELSAWESRNSY